MAVKPSSPEPNATPATPIKQARSRKAATPSQSEQGRAGSAGGVVLPKDSSAKVSASSSKKAVVAPSTDEVTAAASKTQKKKPRKLNKEPTSTPADTAKSAATNKSDVPSSSELEALKSRVRGLEAKVEELYKAGAIPDSRPGRSPRRRGKGRKASSSAQVPTLNTTVNDSNARVQELDDDDEEEEADEELVRLEGELEVARQDLEHYHPSTRGGRSGGAEYVEEINRGSSGTSAGTDRQVTLSGSYRIPIPANVNLEDVKTIKSGVSAAQNVARSFLEQRRAAAALRAENNASSSPQSNSKTTKVPASKTSSGTTPKPKRSMSSSMEVAVDNSDGKQSWSEWIGGYSMAITRAVSKIEHEAAVEAQRSGGSGSGSGSARPAAGGRRTSAPMSKRAAGKRHAAKATLSSEQVHGLMS
jgi:hypothetical protein